MDMAGVAMLHRSGGGSVVPQREAIYRWRRIDGLTLEVLRLYMDNGAGSRASSRLIDASLQPFVIDYEWELDRDWRTRRVSIRTDSADRNALVIERAGETSWQVNGASRSDLDGCDEVDLSITPFCNTLMIKRVALVPGSIADAMTLYVSFPELTSVPSRQRYERLDATTVRYVDLGAVRGFQATLTLDEDRFVRNYENLFERVEP
jgi:hypothetical protein